jgi:anti-sigma B factor antagonist
MSDTSTTMEVRRPAGGVSVIDVEGDLTGESEATLVEAFGRAADDGTGTIVFNFEGLGYMNSSGIGLLVTTLIRAQRNDQRLMAYGLSEHYRQIFSLTRLDEVITLHEDETQALAS